MSGFLFAGTVRIIIINFHLDPYVETTEDKGVIYLTQNKPQILQSTKTARPQNCKY
jgi:hypothetical protein